jgi:hypothetical protein
VLLFVGDGVGRERAVADLTAATREVHRSLVTASDT